VSGAPAAGEVLEVQLQRDASSPQTARRALEERFAAALSPGELEAARLLVSELVSNAVVHGRGTITVRGELDHRRLLVEVSDQGNGTQRPIRTDDPGDGQGWGLWIVAVASSRWGVREGPGTRVWCELDRLPSVGSGARHVV
jgi:anti-sigma regulatory factor (Ser/Thr protein kinase)